VVIGDLNGDGRPDLAAANYDSDNVSVLRGIGNGTFIAAINYVAGGAGVHPFSVAIGTLNGDSSPDLAVANTSSGVSVLLNTMPAGCFVGACCVKNECAAVTNEAACLDLGGTYQGGASTCETVSCAPPCPADCVGSGDGEVNVADLLALLSQWNSSGACDIDGSGVVNVTDLLALLSAWGACA
jgi:hypothetical protein